MPQKRTPELDICVSASSNLVHIEEKVSGRNIATMTMKDGTKEEKIAMAMKFTAAEDMLDALKTCFDPSLGSFLDKARAAVAKAEGWYPPENIAARAKKEKRRQ